VRGQSRHCRVSAAGTDPNGCSPPEGIGRWEFCTVKRDEDGLEKGFARNREECGADATTSPIKDFGEGINVVTTPEKVKLVNQEVGASARTSGRDCALVSQAQAI